MEKFRQQFIQIPISLYTDIGISDFSKLLFGVIYSLSHESGFCFASNEYLSSLFKKSPATISRAISQLKENDYVYADNNGKFNHRRLFINHDKLNANEDAVLSISDMWDTSNSMNTLSNFDKYNIKANIKEDDKRNIIKDKNSRIKNSAVKTSSKNLDSKEKLNVYSSLEDYQKQIDVVLKDETTFLNVVKEICLKISDEIEITFSSIMNAIGIELDNHSSKSIREYLIKDGFENFFIDCVSNVDENLLEERIDDDYDPLIESDAIESFVDKYYAKFNSTVALNSTNVNQLA